MIKANSIQKETVESTLTSLPESHWLRSKYTDSQWIVTDTFPTSPTPPRKITFKFILYDPLRPNKICYFTDPCYEHFLNTAKQQIYGLRIGKFATVTSAVVHANMASAIFTWISWIISKGIPSFSDLNQDDFEIYVNESLNGPVHLLSHTSRLKRYIQNLKTLGHEIPSIKKGARLPVLDRKRILANAGIDTRFVNTHVAYELAKLAESQGFYLLPRAKKLLETDPPKLKRVRTIPLLKMLQPWDYQWRMRKSISGDCIKFDPFEDLSLDALYNKLALKSGRTLTAPVQQTMELIEYSLKWVFEYSSILLDLRDDFVNQIRADFTRGQKILRLKKIIADKIFPNEIGGLNPLYAISFNMNKKNGIAFGTALNSFLPSACFIVIAAFTARRRNEVSSIRAKGENNDDCLSYDENGFYLETYIEKTIQDWVKTPCPEVVVKAVEVLRRWSQPARERSKTTNLFQSENLINSKVIKYEAGRRLRDFVKFLLINPLPDGSYWDFKPHQFRRFFSIMYFWRYQYGNLPALSFHLRHFNSDMTQLYVTEPELGAIFKKVGNEFTNTILTEASLGKRNISGPLGEKFKELIRRLYIHNQRLTKVVSPKFLQQTVDRYLEKNGRQLKGFKWGYCACGSTLKQLSTARCLQNQSPLPGSKPDLSESSPSICGDCPHHLTDEVFKDYWLSEVELHRQAALDPQNGHILREISRQHAETLERQFNRSFIDSQPVNFPDE